MAVAESYVYKYLSSKVRGNVVPVRSSSQLRAARAGVLYRSIQSFKTPLSDGCNAVRQQQAMHWAGERTAGASRHVGVQAMREERRAQFKAQDEGNSSSVGNPSATGMVVGRVQSLDLLGTKAMSQDTHRARVGPSSAVSSMDVAIPIASLNHVPVSVSGYCFHRGRVQKPGVCGLNRALVLWEGGAETLSGCSSGSASEAVGTLPPHFSAGYRGHARGGQGCLPSDDRSTSMFV